MLFEGVEQFGLKFIEKLARLCFPCGELLRFYWLKRSRVILSRTFEVFFSLEFALLQVLESFLVAVHFSFLVGGQEQIDFVIPVVKLPLCLMQLVSDIR
jgi:hypothetical protein